MSKSKNNTIDLFDPPKLVEKKLKGAFTDPQKLRLGDPGRPEICNIFTMHRALSAPEAVADVEVNCRSGALPCGECKMRLCTAMLAELNPMRERAEALRAEPKRVLEVLGDGASRARRIAHDTMRDVHRAMGLDLGQK